MDSSTGVKFLGYTAHQDAQATVTRLIGAAVGRLITSYSRCRMPPTRVDWVLVALAALNNFGYCPVVLDESGNRDLKILMAYKYLGRRAEMESWHEM